MAVDVGRSPSEESLSGEGEADGRWDSADMERDFPRLAGSLHQLLGTEEAKPSLQGTEGVALSRHSHMAADLTHRGSSCRPQVSSASPSKFPGARANSSGKEFLVDNDADGDPVPCRAGRWFLSSKEQQMFCCQLEELIRWLYTVVDVTGSWVPPSPDAESVLASLRRYLEFRKDVADHRSLTESVLERGEALLDCMASNSPALKDTLALIAKQSEELESHAEHLYKSILAAVGGKDAGQDKEGSAHSCSLGAASVRPRLR